MKDNQKLVLASSSAGRLHLLQQASIIPDIVAAMDVDESYGKNEHPQEIAKRLAIKKAQVAHQKFPNDFVIAADTVVAVGRRILDKTYERSVAKKYLELLSGRRNKVYTAVAVSGNDGEVRMRLVTSAVKFKRLSQSEIDNYLATDEWKGKSGGYSIGGISSAFIMSINGSYSGVVGLPMYETCNLLNSVGFRIMR